MNLLSVRTLPFLFILYVAIMHVISNLILIECTKHIFILQTWLSNSVWLHITLRMKLKSAILVNPYLNWLPLISVIMSYFSFPCHHSCLRTLHLLFSLKTLPSFFTSWLSPPHSGFSSNIIHSERASWPLSEVSAPPLPPLQLLSL